MSNAAPWMTANEIAGPSRLLITLLDGTTVDLNLRGTEPQVVLSGIFVAGYFRADDGTYHAASQIKSAVPKEGT